MLPSMRFVNPSYVQTAVKCSRPSITTISKSPLRPFQLTQARNMSSDLGIENTNIKAVAGVTLDDKQKTLMGCVLDLFAGRPSLKKLQLWDDNATFEDPITIAQGRKKYEPQWYGLQTAFSEIERLHYEVTSAGNPMAMDLKTRYVIKGINKEQTVESKVLVSYDEASGKITKVQDKWDGKLPDSSFTDAMRKLNAVTVPQIVSVSKTDEEDAQRLAK